MSETYTTYGIGPDKQFDELQTLRDERDRLTKEYVRLFRLGEPIAKMLSELSILPIGCSREQELAWKMAVKNFRHYQRDYAADVLLQAALTPAKGVQQHPAFDEYGEHRQPTGLGDL